MSYDLKELYWAAGFLEGEGCFTCSKAKHKPRKSDGGISYIIYHCAQIDMTDKDVLDKFARVLGFGKVNGPYQSHRGNRKPTWKWTVINKQAEAVIERFRPFLCERRLRQIDKMLSQCGKFDTIKGATIEAQ